MSELKVNKISPRSGTDVTLGDSGDTFTLPTGVTLDTSNSTVTLPDGSVTNAKIVDSTIELAKLSATGTKDATTFLRGDNTFAEAGGGKVLQVVQGTATSATTTSTSFTSTGLSASITPSSTSSKILIIVTLVQCAVDTANKNATSTIFRGATNLAPTGTGVHKSFATIYASSGGALANNQTYSYLDSPSTTSATTYTVYFAVDSGALMTMGINSTTSYIQLLEIGT